jgi:hypothetical protein
MKRQLSAEEWRKKKAREQMSKAEAKELGLIPSTRPTRREAREKRRERYAENVRQARDARL